MEQLAKLPSEEQDALAALIEANLAEDRRWQAALDKQHALVLDRLLTEAQEQVARGEARDLDESLRSRGPRPPFVNDPRRFPPQEHRCQSRLLNHTGLAVIGGYLVVFQSRDGRRGQPLAAG